VLVNQLPYANEHIVDGLIIQGDMVATMELCPDNTVQLYIHDGDNYLEKADFNTPEGQALIRDAFTGVPLEDGVNEWKANHSERFVV
jgi:hypothetical protein